MKVGILGHLKPFSRLVFVIMLMIACFVITAVAGTLIAIPLFHVNLFRDVTLLSDFDNPDSIALLKFFQILQSAGLFIFPALLAGFLFENNTFGYGGLKKFPKPVVFLLVTGIMFASLPMINWLSSVNEMMRLPTALGGLEQWMKDTEEEAGKITEAFLDVSTAGGFLVNLLMIAIIPAIGEELFFRGVLQRLLGEWFKNRHVAIFLTAFIFGAIHMQFYGLLPRVMLGLMFGYFYVWTDSLWVPVLAHFLNNGAAVVVSFMAGRGLIKTSYEDFGSTDNVFLITGSILFTLSLF
jgi:membrane protease YdiL (CAAX protease family)